MKCTLYSFLSILSRRLFCMYIFEMELAPRSFSEFIRRFRILAFLLRVALPTRCRWNSLLHWNQDDWKRPRIRIRRINNIMIEFRRGNHGSSHFFTCRCSNHTFFKVPMLRFQGNSWVAQLAPPDSPKISTRLGTRRNRDRLMSLVP